MANKIIHKHSSVITDGKAKLPVASQLEYGELAINYAEGVETISLKNSANNIVEIKSTNYLEKIIIDNELVTAAALTNLDERIEEIDSVFGDAISETNEKIVEIAGTFDNAISETNAKVTKNELVTAHALTDLDDRLSSIEDADYASDLAQIYEEIGTIDTKIEEQIGSANIEIGEQIETINTTIEENEHVVAAALTDLDKRLKIVETNGGGGGGNAGDLTDYAKKSELDTLIAEVEDNEYVTALAVTKLESRVTAIEEGAGSGSSNDHTHGTINLTGDVTGSGTIGSGTTAINITTVVANNSHTHTSANISDSISVSTNITSSATGLVQGKAVHGMVTTIEGQLNDRIDALVTDIEDNEYVTALAVTELESRVAQLEQTIATLQETLANVTAQLANTLTVE
jgi:hypothetical protein